MGYARKPEVVFRLTKPYSDARLESVFTVVNGPASPNAQESPAIFMSKQGGNGVVERAT